jgi:hypothetical protein
VPSGTQQTNKFSYVFTRVRAVRSVRRRQSCSIEPEASAGPCTSEVSRVAPAKTWRSRPPRGPYCSLSTSQSVPAGGGCEGSHLKNTRRGRFHDGHAAKLHQRERRRKEALSCLQYRVLQVGRPAPEHRELASTDRPSEEHQPKSGCCEICPPRPHRAAQDGRRTAHTLEHCT